MSTLGRVEALREPSASLRHLVPGILLFAHTHISACYPASHNIQHILFNYTEVQLETAPGVVYIF